MAKQKHDDRVRQLAERLFVATWQPTNNGHHPSKLVKDCCEAAKNFYEHFDADVAQETETP